MNHFPLQPVAGDHHPTVARVFGEIEQELGFGMVPNVFRAMAGSPSFLEANWMLFRGVVLQGRLPRILKEMVGIVVSKVHGSEYARQVHMHSLNVQGVAGEVLAALGDGEVSAVGLTPANAAVLAFARDVAARPASVGPAHFERLAKAGIGQAEAFEVVAAIQLFTAVNLFTDAAGVPVDAL